MSHEAKVYMIVIAIVAGTVYAAEKMKGPAVAAAPVAQLATTVAPFSQTKTSSLLKAKSPAKKAAGFDVAQVLLDQEMDSLNHGKVDWKQREATVRAQAEKLSYNDLMNLAAKSVDTSLNVNERLMTVYLISLSGIKAHNALFEIVKTPYVYSKTSGLTKVTFENQELNLRLRALQALDQLALVNPQQIQKTMKIVTKSTASMQIKNYAQISVKGFAHGQPAKLSQWLNQTIASRGE
ncbi:hypothetical protein B9G69_005275 [Bdellovibrio sp. SKB1291214]|uniref:hypothetical protein n=1 Tax=Bdellovibrio sp. SKB1291214 TaxID=1732569 RepID=UPI000B51A6D1|nr:hypothetical protein [Bdellovibrio sp. SKB1291214]UYL09986.1 hypothetical protein B9G69_005275 [Bdellovibrio sp. SKB1291214]